MYHIHNFWNICQHILKSQNRFIHHVHTYVKKKYSSPMQNACWFGLATLTKDHLIFHKYFSHFLLYSLLNVLNSEFGLVIGSKLSLTLSIRRGCFQEPPGILLLWNNLYYTCFICSDTGGFGSELFDPPLNKAASLLTKPGAHPGGYLLCYCMFWYNSHNVYFWMALSLFSAANWW